MDIARVLLIGLATTMSFSVFSQSVPTKTGAKEPLYIEKLQEVKVGLEVNSHRIYQLHAIVDCNDSFAGGLSYIDHSEEKERMVIGLLKRPIQPVYEFGPMCQGMFGVAASFVVPTTMEVSILGSSDDLEIKTDASFNSPSNLASVAEVRIVRASPPAAHSYRSYELSVKVPCGKFIAGKIHFTDRAERNAKTVIGVLLNTINDPDATCASYAPGNWVNVLFGMKNESNMEVNILGVPEKGIETYIDRSLPPYGPQVRMARVQKVQARYSDWHSQTAYELTVSFPCDTYILDRLAYLERTGGEDKTVLAVLTEPRNPSSHFTCEGEQIRTRTVYIYPGNELTNDIIILGADEGLEIEAGSPMPPPPFLNF